MLVWSEGVRLGSKNLSDQSLKYDVAVLIMLKLQSSGILKSEKIVVKALPLTKKLHDQVKIKENKPPLVSH